MIIKLENTAGAVKEFANDQSLEKIGKDLENEPTGFVVGQVWPNWYLVISEMKAAY